MLLFIFYLSTVFYNFILLQAGATNDIGSFVLPVAMLAVFFLFFIRPQQRKQKEQKKLMNEIKKGDFLVTMGGIHGKVTDVAESTITLDIDRGTKLTIEKSSVSLELTKKYTSDKK